MLNVLNCTKNEKEALWTVLRLMNTIENEMSYCDNLYLTDKYTKEIVHSFDYDEIMLMIHFLRGMVDVDIDDLDVKIW